MRIGIIYCAYSSEEYVEKSLSPFIEGASGHSFVISAISYPFVGFEKGGNKKTLDILRKYRDEGKIYLNYGSEEIEEPTARQIALDQLLEIGVDLIWMVDSDELYTKQQIHGIIKFVQEEEFVAWFRLSFKNRVFDFDYLEEPFCPPRIFRIKVSNYQINRFIDDNNLSYRGRLKRDIVPDLALSNMTVPKSVAWIDHYTWLDTPESKGRTKKKVEYQLKHFGICSYKWDYKENKLEFDEKYYEGKSLPKVLKDEGDN